MIKDVIIHELGEWPLNSLSGAPDTRPSCISVLVVVIPESFVEELIVRLWPNYRVRQPFLQAKKARLGLFHAPSRTREAPTAIPVSNSIRRLHG